MKIEFTRHVFTTLTYSREYSSESRWSTVSKDFNRYLQEMRRYHLQLDYLRVVESHKDGYPHIHIILQFPDARIRVENARYFTPELYARWRSFWKHGHSDYQKPRRSGIHAVSYVMKYLLKNQTKKTVWKKVFASTADAGPTDKSNQSEPVKSITVSALLEKPPVKYLGVKLCTWSRGFDFSVFLARRPESVVKGLKDAHEK